MQAAGLYRVAEVIYSIWTGKSLLFLAVVALVAPVLAAVANGFVWGQVDKIVFFAASTYAALAFGWLATILAYRKISPKYKFVVTSYHFNCNPIPNTVPHSNQQMANNFQAVINLKNIADFPISYVVRNIEFRIQNTIGNNVFTNRGATIDSDQSSTFSSDVVTFHQPINLPVTGVLTADILYGRRTGNERFERPISLVVDFFVDPTTTSGVGYHWRNT